MRGRIYDPRIGRFLQADPFVQTSIDTQMFNRFSYARNNPLNLTDPSGYILPGLIPLIVGAAISTAVVTIQAIIANGALGLLNLLGPLGSFLYNGIAYGWGSAIQGAFISAMSAVLSYATYGMFAGLETWVQVIGTAAVQGVIGGVTSVMQGGNFGNGFLSSAVSSLAGSAAGAVGAKFGPTAGFVAKVVAGGTVSEVTGGKFASGAITSAFTAAISAVATAEAEPSGVACDGGGVCPPMKGRDITWEMKDKNESLDDKITTSIVDGVRVTSGHLTVSGEEAQRATDQLNAIFNGNEGKTGLLWWRKTYRSEISFEAVASGGDIQIQPMPQERIDFYLRCNLTVPAYARYGESNIFINAGRVGETTFPHEFMHVLGISHAPFNSRSMLSYHPERRLVGRDFRLVWENY